MKIIQKCKIPGCKRAKRTQGMCNAHYARFRRSGSPIGEQVFRDQKPKTCTVEGCCKPYMARGFCGMHYERQRTKGHLMAKPTRAKGSGTIKEGYVVFVRHCSGRKIRIRRCRLVMEKHLGRKLRSNETVHHKNGNKQDDEPSNLELWASIHPKGQRVSDLIKYARFILRRYA